MNENALRAFLRANPTRAYSTRELSDALPDINFLHNSTGIARRIPDLIARRETYMATRGFLKGRTCTRYFWQDNPAVDLPVVASKWRNLSGEHEFDGLSENNLAEIAAAIRDALGYDALCARVEHLERITQSDYDPD